MILEDKVPAFAQKQIAATCGLSYAGAKRIIGGTEIVPHSEPWLAPLCISKW